MKTLYISDLDGTLLNKNVELSKYTVNTLNKLISRGFYFSVATARSAATVESILESVKIDVPVILMNGVLIYNMATKQYVKKEMLFNEKITQILTAMKNVNITGLMYALSGCDGELITYYERIYNDALQSFIDERKAKYNKKFVKIDDFGDADTDIFYFCYIDTYENISKLYNEVTKISGLRIEMYPDVYFDGDLWYMEVFNDTASKYSAVIYLKEKYGFERIVSFGDNFNDLPLFRASDECYAVSNAKDEVKEIATAVIASNEEDGVAKWLELIAHKTT